MMSRLKPVNKIGATVPIWAELVVAPLEFLATTATLVSATLTDDMVKLVLLGTATRMLLLYQVYTIFPGPSASVLKVTAEPGARFVLPIFKVKTGTLFDR